MKEGDTHKSNTQLVWGIALILVGVAVFVRISYVMPKLAEMGQFGGFARFGLYLMGVILVGGGIKKLVAYVNASKAPSIENKDDHELK